MYKRQHLILGLWKFFAIKTVKNYLNWLLFSIVVESKLHHFVALATKTFHGLGLVSLGLDLSFELYDMHSLQWLSITA